jgi:phosphatidylglycerol---prolipoprotein diacylglyceryl transferase
MFQVSPNPIIFHVGSFQLSYYLLTVVLGFLVILFVLLRASRKNKIGLSEEEVYDFVILLILGTVIGARVFHVVFWGWNYYSQNFVKVFYIWEGGLSFHGGLVGAFAVALIYAKLKKLSFLKIADILVVPTVLFLALGRIANFFNSEILGTAANVPWCVVFQNIDSVCRHPIQLYAAAGRFLLFFVLFFIGKKFKERKDGLLFWTFVLLISVGRFFLDFLREGSSFYELLVGQWFSLILIIVSVGAFWKLRLLRQKC